MSPCGGKLYIRFCLSLSRFGHFEFPSHESDISTSLEADVAHEDDSRNQLLIIDDLRSTSHHLPCRVTASAI